jgi:hypothetical protein
MAAADELIRLRYPATCAVCGRELPRGSLARWVRTTKQATCDACVAGDQPAASELVEEIDRGEAGASAAREWKRRHEKREGSLRAQHRHLGGLLLALSFDPHSTTAWATGARGEQAIGQSLDKLRSEEIVVLHDRRIPGGRANVDHIVISRAGVFVIDTKHYRGRVERRDVGGFFRTDFRLYVGGRYRTKLVARMKPQVDAVRRALADHDDWNEVPITPACQPTTGPSSASAHSYSARCTCSGEKRSANSSAPNRPATASTLAKSSGRWRSRYHRCESR